MESRLAKSKKIKTLNELKRIVRAAKKMRKKIVFTNGCFDIIHFGHVSYLKKCKELGSVLIVGLNSDSSVRRIKGRGRPVTKERERSIVLSALESIDYVTIFGDSTPGRIITSLTPDILVKGGDWRKKDIVGADHVKRFGGRVVTVPFVKGYSTTSLIERIKKISG
ncbi:MAG: D-glycero-beta-D-manno-heptose 1-phosphate adenylyltransferase [Candidatus Omnitrophota bacterium]